MKLHFYEVYFIFYFMPYLAILHPYVQNQSLNIFTHGFLGDESDNDDEDDEDEDDEDFWETDEEVHHNAGRALSDSTRSIDRLSLESGSTSSSSGNLSVLSNFGSSHEDTDTVVRIPSRLSSWDSDSTR